MRIIQPNPVNPGDKKPTDVEQKVPNVSFNVHKFNKRPHPHPKDVIIVCCFSEFGCETISILYCLPRLLREYPNKYIVVAGWYGRAYLYRHLVDEFWEIREEFQFLREYCRAFHHESVNLKFLERKLQNQGTVIPSDYVGRYALGTKCNACGYLWGEEDKPTECQNCKSLDITPSLFNDIGFWKKRAVRLPKPSASKLAAAKQYLKPNPVGIFARGIKKYGRNLQPEFYVKLINHLEERGYNPIWLGEKQSTQPCPVDHILDYSRLPESRDLELTLAIISQLDFTVQFWTASTRLSSMLGVPYLLFESPDQLWGAGQEGYRRELATFGPFKLAICHFLNVLNNNDGGIDIVDRCITEMEQGNYEDVFGLLEDKTMVEESKKKWQERL